MAQSDSGARELEIRRGGLRDEAVIALLQEHLRCMQIASPPESCHALDVIELQQDDVTFWSMWDGSQPAGCGALKQLDAVHGEIKSMRTADGYQRRGVASAMLRHLMNEARCRGYRRLSLETGSMEYFEPARRLYASFGFQLCAPFAEYRHDPNSVFMTIEL